MGKLEYRRIKVKIGIWSYLEGFIYLGFRKSPEGVCDN